MRRHIVESEHRVTPLELFFDLVFVFGFTQVTTLLHDDATWHGLARALLVLTVLWWAWASYAWLTNTLDANDGPVVASMLVATGAMFLAALAVPEAFSGHRFVFAVSFVLVLAMFVVLFVAGVRGEPDLLAAILRTTPFALSGGLLILAAAFVGAGARPYVWLVAVAGGFAAPVFADVRGWHLHPAHFAERHSLIVIIAIGESLVALGLGARDTGLGAGVVVAVLLGLAVAASFWLAYFDYFGMVLEQLVASRQGTERTALARDVYTYLHLLMIAGIVLFAAAMRIVLVDLHARLHAVPALCLCFGCGLYLLAYVVLRWRISRTLGRGRTSATVAFFLLFPLSLHVPALAALALCAAVWLGLHAYELIWWREERVERRSEPVADRLVAGGGPS